MQPTLSDLVIAETVRLIERSGPLEDGRAMTVAFAGHTSRDDRLLARARILGERYGLTDAWQRWRALLPVALLAAAALVGLLSLGICSAVVGHDRQINALAALASVLGPHLLSLLVWMLALVLGGRAVSGAGIGRGVLWLATRLSPGSRAMIDDPARMAERRPALALLPQALLGVLQRARLLPWLLGFISHAAWALGFVLILAGLFMAFSFQAYRLNWETTILSPAFFVDFVRMAGWLPARLGFAAPDQASVLQASTAAAAQQWAWWLIGCTVAYGLLPRLALAAVSAAVWRARRPGLRMDLADPYYRGLIARFDAMEASQVVEVEQPQPSQDTPSQRAEDGRGGTAAIGFELPPETVWPRPSLSVTVAWTERIDGSSEERLQMLDRIARMRPRRLIIACNAGSSPDRGVERFLRDAAVHGPQLRLLLVDAVGGAGVRRWRDWLAASDLGHIELSTDEAAAAHWLAAVEAPTHG